MRDGEKKNENIKMMLNGRQLLLGLGTLGALAVLLAVGLAPDEAAAPGPEPSVAQVDSAAGVTLAADCQVVQHLIYTPCGHELTRRQPLPEELVGKGRAEAEAAYDLWQITSFSATELAMEQTVEIYCPEHQVLMPDASGVLCIFENHYGDALALVRSLDTPQNLYDYPINLFVAGFIGTPQMNFFPAKLTKQKGRVYVEFVNNKILLPKSVEVRIQNIDDYLDTDKPITLGVRPEDIHDEESFISASPDTVIKAFIEVVEKLGAETQIYCKLDFKEGEEIEDATEVIGGSSNMVAKIDSRSTVSRGEVVELAIDARHIHIFDGETEMSLLARDEGYEITPENEASSAFVPLTPQEMRAIIEKNKVVTKEEKKAMRREARAEARKERLAAKEEAAKAAAEAEENAEDEAPADEAPEETPDDKSEE